MFLLNKKSGIISIVCFLFLQFSCISLNAQSSSLLWYNEPARYFEESLALGNGRMGACVFGGVNSDMIYLNDITLWSGEPVNPNMNPEAYKNIPAIREALKNENYELADQLNHTLQGRFSESFAPLGTLYIDFENNGKAQNYYRELNISNAVSRVSYEAGGVQYTREYYVSYPDQVMVIKVSASKKNALNFIVKFTSLLNYNVSVSANTLEVNGRAPVHTEPNYRGNIRDSIVFEENRGTRFTSLVKIKNTGGRLISANNTIGIEDGTEAVIYLSMATSFNGYDKNPFTEGLNEQAIAAENLNKAYKKDIAEVKASHIQDYQKYFKRVSLDLGKTDAPDLPTGERLKRYAEGKEDKNLEILYFQFGRYLLISSSRTPGVPANLQGLWNPYIRPPWSCNYTTNINAEENYWLAENTNLSEMHLPMLGFIRNISKTGEVTAKTFYGANGWAACHNSDIWAMSNPVGDFGKGDPNWANWNMGGAWLSTHLWEHFSFTQDMNFLENEAYPLLRGAAQFCLEWLIEDKEGNLITSPSTSPENRYITPTGYHGATLYGSTSDMAMIRECFEQTIRASQILNADTLFREDLIVALSRLYPYQIGKKGNLQEWYFDWEDEEPTHRHQSHLFGLFPGHQISQVKTTALANACRKTLEIKGDQTTGWSKGWRINLWARLQDGNHAYKMYRELLHYVEPDSVKTSYSGGGGTYPNLFDAHPPFQIDGNFGGSAAVAEMLVQSGDGKIYLLPALPDVWEKGSVKGICARGGFEISMEWENKSISKVVVLAKESGKTRVINGDRIKDISLQKGQSIIINWLEN